ncbi:DUF3305 domain-containing protein [Vibrio sp.]|uniref:DUF3305 domain-containing protein n=1 Tax=Vibrio sp. TaxID=678 RepID=UPI003D0CC24C
MPVNVPCTELPTKTDSQWPIRCQLELQEVQVGRWITAQWQLVGFDLAPTASDMAWLTLQLFRDERTDYRFNLSSREPKLFVILENLTEPEAKLVRLTAAQNVAARYMDSDYIVLSAPMPLAVQAWMEAYIGREGELLACQTKKRKGAGRASGK